MSPAVDRRTWLKAAGAAVIGAGFGFRCAAPATRTSRLTKVHVSPDRVIRTTVGLRPTRQSGFVLKSERVDDKTVIHNYGHGGSGMSLSRTTLVRRTASAGCPITASPRTHPTRKRSKAASGGSSPICILRPWSSSRISTPSRPRTSEGAGRCGSSPGCT